MYVATSIEDHCIKFVSTRLWLVFFLLVMVDCLLCFSGMIWSSIRFFSILLRDTQYSFDCILNKTIYDYSPLFRIDESDQQDKLLSIKIPNDLGPGSSCATTTRGGTQHIGHNHNHEARFTRISCTMPRCRTKHLSCSLETCECNRWRYKNTARRDNCMYIRWIRGVGICIHSNVDIRESAVTSLSIFTILIVIKLRVY